MLGADYDGPLLVGPDTALTKQVAYSYSESVVMNRLAHVRHHDKGLAKTRRKARHSPNPSGSGTKPNKSHFPKVSISRPAASLADPETLNPP